jgi:aldehyde:ferredoxin oxidoreductase
MAAPKGGYFGKILEIDLTKQQFKTRPLSDETARTYIEARDSGLTICTRK